MVYWLRKIVYINKCDFFKNVQHNSYSIWLVVLKFEIGSTDLSIIFVVLFASIQRCFKTIFKTYCRKRNFFFLYGKIASFSKIEKFKQENKTDGQPKTIFFCVLENRLSFPEKRRLRRRTKRKTQLTKLHLSFIHLNKKNGFNFITRRNSNSNSTWCGQNDPYKHELELQLF